MDSSRKNVNRVNIAQWNAQSVRPKIIAFDNFLIQNKIHIAVLNETWLEPDSIFKISNYNIYRCDRNDGYGGVALIVHKTIQSHIGPVVNNYSGIEILHVKILNCDFIENIFSVYCPPSASTSLQDWNNIFSIASRKSLILGDLNGHHTNWSCKNDSRGFQIFNALLDNSFVSLNDGKPTRVKLVNGVLQQSAPDLSLASSDIALKFYWNVTNETLGSDHRIILLSTFLEKPKPYKSKRNFKLADWKSYSDLLNSLFSSFPKIYNLQLAYDTFEEYLNIAADLHIPVYRINPNPTNKFVPKPYWTPRLSEAVAQRRLALANVRRNSIPIVKTR
ncbi:endonuclease-reverse transcriptase domain-containing protein [Phthorimaea operculella]|nr:endonuclease-reverse transcriptase domain-containing protein [Phthorimaea operculella]